MAKEFKTLTVVPSAEQDTIDARCIFGWELQSSQEINTKESHIEGGFTGNYSVTTTENYVKLTFMRNPENVENYKELTEIERKYDAVPDPGSMPTFSMILAVILIFLWIIPGIIYIVSYSSKKKKYFNACVEYAKERSEILEQARKIAVKNY